MLIITKSNCSILMIFHMAEMKKKPTRKTKSRKQIFTHVYENSYLMKLITKCQFEQRFSIFSHRFIAITSNNIYYIRLSS